jgi:hypothetical protein
VVFPPVCVRSSIPADADVITASVRNGLISDTAPTNVVFPTPKPPATTIFADVVEREGAERPVPLELAKSTEHPFEQRHIWLTAGLSVMARLVNGDEPGFGQISHQNPSNAKGNGKEGGDFRDGLDLVAQLTDPLVLRKLAL